MGANIEAEIAVAQSDVRRAEVALSQAHLELSRVRRELESLLRQSPNRVDEQNSDGRTLLNG
jgi:hypothetical protein